MFSAFRNTAMVAVVGAILSAASPARALLMTLDQPDQTIVRPTTGTTAVNFTGHITADAGYDCCGGIIDALYTATLNSLAQSPFPTDPPSVSGAFDGVIFSLTVSATDTLGLYAYTSLGSPVSYSIYECPSAGGGACPGSTVAYSLDVVSWVPEPGALSIFATAPLAILLVRRLDRASRAPA
jgi:hypothetical protein